MKKPPGIPLGVFLYIEVEETSVNYGFPQKYATSINAYLRENFVN